jgi:hypothetical protein
MFPSCGSALKPGKYFEMHEIDSGIECDDDFNPADSSALQWSNLFFEGRRRIGYPIPAPAEYKTLMEEAGFVDVRLKIMKNPTNVWPKERNMKRLLL